MITVCERTCIPHRRRRECVEKYGHASMRAMLDYDLGSECYSCGARHLILKLMRAPDGNVIMVCDDCHPGENK